MKIDIDVDNEFLLKQVDVLNSLLRFALKYEELSLECAIKNDLDDEVIENAKSAIEILSRAINDNSNIRKKVVLLNALVNVMGKDLIVGCVQVGLIINEKNEVKCDA